MANYPDTPDTQTGETTMAKRIHLSIRAHREVCAHPESWHHRASPWHTTCGYYDERITTDDAAETDCKRCIAVNDAHAPARFSG